MTIPLYDLLRDTKNTLAFPRHMRSHLSGRPSQGATLPFVIMWVSPLDGCVMARPSARLRRCHGLTARRMTFREVGPLQGSPQFQTLHLGGGLPYIRVGIWDLVRKLVDLCFCCFYIFEHLQNALLLSSIYFQHFNFESCPPSKIKQCSVELTFHCFGPQSFSFMKYACIFKIVINSQLKYYGQ